MNRLELGSSMAADMVESGLGGAILGLLVWWLVPDAFGLPIDLMLGAVVASGYTVISYNRKRSNLLKSPPSQPG